MIQWLQVKWGSGDRDTSLLKERLLPTVQGWQAQLGYTIPPPPDPDEKLHAGVIVKEGVLLMALSCAMKEACRDGAHDKSVRNAWRIMRGVMGMLCYGDLPPMRPGALRTTIFPESKVQYSVHSCDVCFFTSSPSCRAEMCTVLCRGGVDFCAQMC
jgi:hypothetical protein